MPYRRVGYAEQIWYILHYKFMEVMHVPRKPKKPCSYTGCPELTEGRYCEKHQKQENARYEKYDRDPAVRRRYGRAWKRIRDSYVKTHPFCEQCYKHGIILQVYFVDLGQNIGSEENKVRPVVVLQANSYNFRSPVFTCAIVSSSPVTIPDIKTPIII